MSTSSFCKRLDAGAAQWPGRIAIVESDGGAIDFSSLATCVRSIARGLIAFGLQPGDRVLFAVRPCIKFVALALGVQEAGGAVVPLDADTGDDLFHARVRLLAPQWVIAESVLLMATANKHVRSWLRACGVALPPLAHVSGARFIRVGPPYPGAWRASSIEALMRVGAACEEEPCVASPSAESFIVFTSGTTGAPKAVVHSRRSMEQVIEAVEAQLGARTTDIVYTKDLHLILPALFAGATSVIPPRAFFKPRRMLADLIRFRVTQLFAVPTECQELLDFAAKQRRPFPDTLRLILLGAAPIYASFLERLRAVLPSATQLWCIYGMTEILPVAFVTLDEKLAYGGEGDLVGPCVPGVAARVNADGELLLRGANLFSRYLGEPSVVEHATGDLARIEAGRIVLLGRRKDMIIRGHKNIYPPLYEPTIERIPGVRRCAMVGVYDSKLADERVVLFVEAISEDAATALHAELPRALREGPFCIDVLAMPDEILFTALLQSGRSSKIDKGALREIARAKLGCE